MTVQELNEDQYKELCQKYICFMADVNGETPSYFDLEAADELVAQDVIYNYYEGVNFTNDDFSCSCSEA